MRLLAGAAIPETICGEVTICRHNPGPAATGVPSEHCYRDTRRD